MAELVRGTVTLTIHCKINWHVAQQHVQASQAENKIEAVDDVIKAVTFKSVLECHMA